MTRGTAALAVALALSACAGQQWVKPGVSADVAASDYAECSSLAQQASRRSGDIEADILASRGRDWENSGTLGAHKNVFAAESDRQTGDVMGNCMRLRGYAAKE
jgi:hypothetical protein